MTQTNPSDLSDFSAHRSAAACPRGHAAARTSRVGVRTRTHPQAWPVLCAAMVCTGALWSEPAQATKARHPRAASTPSTAQILAPSAATVPDALPPERTIYRCGNSYSSTPCGDAPALDVADARSDAQRRQADDVAARDKRLASWMEAGRRERDTVASEPKKSRSVDATPTCVDTVKFKCVPRKTPVRRAVSKAAASAPVVHR